MKKYLFDFDGTLVDSMPTYSSTMLRILDEHNIKYDESIIKTITPLGLLGTAEYYVGLGINKTVEQIVEIMREYMLSEYLYNIPAKSGVIETLKELKKEGADLTVLTASPHATLDPCLKRLGIYDIFTNVWSCEDFNTTKADPQIYKMAAEKMNARVNEVLFLDDNLDADKTAKKAGILVCGVYDKSSEDYREDIKSVSDFYIDDFKELLNIKF